MSKSTNNTVKILVTIALVILSIALVCGVVLDALWHSIQAGLATIN